MNAFLDARDNLWQAFYAADPSFHNDHFREFERYTNDRFDNLNALVAFGSSNMENNLSRLHESLSHCPIFANDEEAGRYYLHTMFETDESHPIHVAFMEMMRKWRAYKILMTGDTDDSASSDDSD